MKFEFCDFWEFFEIFKKASRGPSAADVDLYVGLFADECVIDFLLLTFMLSFDVIKNNNNN